MGDAKRKSDSAKRDCPGGSHNCGLSHWEVQFYWGIGFCFGFDPKYRGWILILPFFAVTYD